MSFFFKKPSNEELLSRLKKKLNVLEERSWKHYLNKHSSIYRGLKGKFNLELTKKEGSKFCLFQKGVNNLDKNFGYRLGEKDQVYLSTPKEKGVLVTNPQAAQSIRQIILKETTALRGATWGELDDIYNLFHKEGYLPKPSDGVFEPSFAGESYEKKRQILNKATHWLMKKKVEYNQAQKEANSLLALPWFGHTKEHFSWACLIDGLVGESSIANADEIAANNLERTNKMVDLATEIERELNKGTHDYSKIKYLLNELQNNLAKDEKNNIFIDFYLALAGVVATPATLLMGLIWLIPAYIFDLPYLGKPHFFLDVLNWFGACLIDVVRCLLFPIAMLHAYTTSGSADIFLGECSRIVNTLLAEWNITPPEDTAPPPLKGSIEEQSPVLENHAKGIRAGCSGV